MGKRKVLTLKEKLQIIDLLNKGKSNADISREFNLSKSTVSTIKKNKDKLTTAQTLNISLKKIRNPERKDVDGALLKWFSYQRSQNVPISGEVLRLKAEELGKLTDNKFVCHKSWVHRFKKRYNIVTGKVDDDHPVSVPVQHNNVDQVFTNEDDLVKSENIDIELITTDTEIKSEVAEDFNYPEENGEMPDSEEQTSPPCIQEVYNAMNILSSYISVSNIGFTVSFDVLQDKIETELLKKLTGQSKTTDYI